MTNITLEYANKIIAGIFSEARRHDLKPMGVAVLDPGGHLVAFAREDGTSNLRPQIAMAKARTSLTLGLPSRKIGEMMKERPEFVATVSALASEPLMPVAGGVLLMDKKGRTVGAVGVTGDTSDNDEACALAAISALECE